MHTADDSRLSTKTVLKARQIGPQAPRKVHPRKLWRINLGAACCCSEAPTKSAAKSAPKQCSNTCRICSQIPKGSDLIPAAVSSKTPVKNTAERAQNSPQARGKDPQQQISPGWKSPLQTVPKSKDAAAGKPRRIKSDAAAAVNSAAAKILLFPSKTASKNAGRSAQQRACPKAQNPVQNTR